MDMEELRSEAKKLKCNVNDLLALDFRNDPFYITDVDKQYAEWIFKMWQKEGRPRIHPRGFHYRILGEGYKNLNATIFSNTHGNWMGLKKGFKYARLKDLIPYDSVLDMKNEEGIETGNFESHSGIFSYEIESMELNEVVKSKKKFIEELIDNISNSFSIGYNSVLLQPFYMEIWAEKSGVIPKEIAKEFNATMRPAGGGEFSLDMCYKALRKAKELQKPLFVFLISDFDPKGRDMPKSVARKIEYMVREQFGGKAYFKHLCLTKEQCEEYDLPSVPAKNPKGISTGAKAYRTHIKMFYDAMDRETTEINAFMSRETKAYNKKIRNELSKYFDKEMGNKVEDLCEDIREEIKAAVKELIDKNKKEILRNAEKLHKANKKLEKFIKQKNKTLKIEQLQKDYDKSININRNDIIDDIEVEFPEADYKQPEEDVLLDTNLDYFEQIERYKQFDFRSKLTK